MLLGHPLSSAFGMNMDNMDMMNNMQEDDTLFTDFTTTHEPGYIIGNIWRPHIPTPKSKLSIWAPICRSDFGILTPRAFTGKINR